jgi:rubrerythrin
MSAVDDAVLSPLRQGMINEIRGRKFYREAAKRAGDPMGRKMYESLGKDEEAHLEILQREYQALTHGERWLAVDEARNSTLPAPQLNLFPDDAEDLLPPDADDLKALELAMGMEKYGYDLYKAAADGASDMTAKSMYEFLVQEESRHYELLQNTYQYLKDKGIWYFQDEEKPFFEG